MNDPASNRQLGRSVSPSADPSSGGRAVLRDLARECQRLGPAVLVAFLGQLTISCSDSPAEGTAGASGAAVGTGGTGGWIVADPGAAGDSATSGGNPPSGAHPPPDATPDTGGAAGSGVSSGGTAHTGGGGGVTVIGPGASGSAVSSGGASGGTGVDPTTTLTLDEASVQLGDTLSGTATFTNHGSETVTLLNMVIAMRPPGGTHAGGPYEDMSPTAQDVTLAPGESFTLEASRYFSASDPTGTWEAYFTYQDEDGYHDQPSAFIEVTRADTPGGDTGGTGGTGSTAGGCDATTTPVARHGQLRIDGGQLVNECGRPVQFASMSMYDWSQQGHQFYNAEAVRNLAGTGQGQKRCTTLRIPLLARNWPSEYDRVRTVMDACIENGIYCIPNWHVVGGSDVNDAREFYVQLARDYGHTPNIIYEPWNEPTSQSWSEIKAYMEDILAAVRPIDPDGIFLAGTRQWCQRPDEACENPIDDPYVGYVFHFYANSHSLEGWFQGNIDTCLNAGLLVWSTEYGGVDADGDGNFNVTEVNRWWDYLDQNLISSNNWAIETNRETSSVFTTDANATGPWPDSQITNSGRHVFEYIAERYPVTMSQ